MAEIAEAQRPSQPQGYRTGTQTSCFTLVLSPSLHHLPPTLQQRGQLGRAGVPWMGTMTWSGPAGVPAALTHTFLCRGSLECQGPSSCRLRACLVHFLHPSLPGDVAGCPHVCPDPSVLPQAPASRPPSLLFLALEIPFPFIRPVGAPPALSQQPPRRLLCYESLL